VACILTSQTARVFAAVVQVGNYFSTKIWSFSMRHHCGCKITITTDPKNAEYLVTEGAQRKVETYDAEDAQVRGCVAAWVTVTITAATRVLRAGIKHRVWC
jgi:hypothetical protein